MYKRHIILTLTRLQDTPHTLSVPHLRESSYSRLVHIHTTMLDFDKSCSCLLYRRNCMNSEFLFVSIFEDIEERYWLQL